MWTMFLGSIVGWIFVRVLRAVMAPSGNLGGNSGSIQPSNVPFYPTAILQGPVVIQGPNQSIAALNPNTGVVSFQSSQQFSPDNSWDIGASGANRPRNIYAAGNTYGNQVNCAFQFNFNLAGGVALWSGSGAPLAGNGNNGDIYFRSDTPGTANQRIYVKSAGAWVGIV